MVELNDMDLAAVSGGGFIDFDPIFNISFGNITGGAGGPGGGNGGGNVSGGGTGGNGNNGGNGGPAVVFPSFFPFL